MDKKIKQITDEILKLKPKSKINFNKYFNKYEILEEEKLECFNSLINNLECWITVKEQSNKNVEDLPYNAIYLKNKSIKFKEFDTEINKDAIKNIIKILENETVYTEVPRKVENDIIYIGYINYDYRITDLFRYMPYYKKDYTKKIDKIIQKDITTLDIEEVKQYLTFIYRKERFCEGFLKNFIDNGILLQLLKHFIEIC